MNEIIRILNISECDFYIREKHIINEVIREINISECGYIGRQIYAGTWIYKNQI